MNSDNTSTPPSSDENGKQQSPTNANQAAGSDPSSAADAPKKKVVPGDASEAKKQAQGLLGWVWQFVRDLMNLKDDTDYERSVPSIVSGIDFRGYNVWVLICSIFIASIGLNMDSAAVIIGAMLISPLMGPILGAGLAIGTNDIPVLFRSLKSYGVAVGVSLLTSFIYFWISPLDGETSELLGRVKPNILDVAVAAFGGVAGVIAVTRKEKTNVIPGVAIATALMPPLCTAGYGLANGNMTYFLGALYLFLLNSVFIWLATFIAIRYLGFPMREFPNPRRERLGKRWIAAFVLLVIIPSGFKMYDVIQENRFDEAARTFVADVCLPDEASVRDVTPLYHEDPQRIEVLIIGKEVSDETAKAWRKMLPAYELEGVELALIQNQASRTPEGNQGIDKEYVDVLLAQNRNLQEEIGELKTELKFYRKDHVDFSQMDRNIKNFFNDMEKYQCGETVASSGEQLDTTFTFIVKWKPEVDSAAVAERETQLKRYLEDNITSREVTIVREKAEKPKNPEPVSPAATVTPQ